MRKSRFLAMGLAASLMLSMVGCGGSEATTSAGNESEDSVELKIMLSGDKPPRWDEVVEEFHNRSEEDLNVKLNVEWVSPGDYKEKLNLKMAAGEEYDLVFDAPWCQLRNIAADEGYVDLAPYFNNPDYPGLQATFSEEVVENNKFFGKNYALPIMRSLTNGIPAIYYRQDLADQYGIGKIESYEQLQEYFEAIVANEPSMIPLGVRNNRGFYSMFTPNGLVENEIVKVSAGVFFQVVLNEDQTAIKAIAAEGDPDEAWADFPEGFQHDFVTDRLQTLTEWNKYLEKDSLNQKDDTALFYSGKAAAIVGTLDDYEKNVTKLTSAIPEAQIGEFVHYDNVREMKEGAISTTYMANNFVAVPVTSEKVDTTMKFLDWLFANQENHDLFELGIEGEDWEAVGEDKYRIPEGIQATNQYVFPGYVLTWATNYVRFDESLSEDILKYKKYELEPSSYTKNPLAGFNFNQEPVKTEIAKVNAIRQEVHTALEHGILPNPKQVLEDNTAECRKNGLDVIEEELIKQINEFLANK